MDWRCYLHLRWHYLIITSTCLTLSKKSTKFCILSFPLKKKLRNGLNLYFHSDLFILNPKGLKHNYEKCGCKYCLKWDYWSASQPADSLLFRVSPNTDSNIATLSLTRPFRNCKELKLWGFEHFRRRKYKP